MISHSVPTTSLILSSDISPVIEMFNATLECSFSGMFNFISNSIFFSLLKYHSCIGSRCNYCVSALLISEKSVPKYINNGCGAIAYKYIG